MTVNGSVSNLQACPLKCEYRSDGDDLARAFYRPLLRVSNAYDRAVGYFTSQSLAIAGQGLSGFIANGGKMRLIASPYLNDEDIGAINRGHDLQGVVEDALVRELVWTETRIASDPLGCLAWLIAEGRLEIRIAVPVDQTGGVRRGLYHEKIGVFSDTKGNKVAFTGSANETGSAFGENFESIDVYWSWEDPQNRVRQKESNFERLWQNTTNGLRILSFPDAAKLRLLRLRPLEPPPDLEPDSSQNRPVVRALRRPQAEAIEAWENNGRKGIVAMATGSGKTLTALTAAKRVPDIAAIIVAVPTLELVKQWTKEISDSGLTAPDRIIAAQGNSNVWSELLHKSLCEGPSSLLVVIGTLKTLSSGKFAAFTQSLRSLGKVLLVADEVHNAGAPVYRRILDDDIPYRLGLSATPIRPHDEGGSSLLLSYFLGVVYEYDLAAAIRDGLLCPYDYRVWFTHLTDEETQEYESLTAKIAFMQTRLGSMEAGVERSGVERLIERLLIRRARIVKTCSSKVAALREVLRECRLERSLIYCADLDQIADVRNVLNEMHIPYGVYTGTLSPAERTRVLAAFSHHQIDVLVAVKCLDEGVNIPALDEAVLVASSQSEREYIQRRGRVLRLNNDKEIAVIHDLFVLPSTSIGAGNTVLLQRELRRAHLMASSSRNRLFVENALERVLRPYGLRLAQILGLGGGN